MSMMVIDTGTLEGFPFPPKRTTRACQRALAAGVALTLLALVERSAEASFPPTLGPTARLAPVLVLGGGRWRIGARGFGSVAGAIIELGIHAALHPWPVFIQYEVGPPYQVYYPPPSPPPPAPAYYASPPASCCVAPPAAAVVAVPSAPPTAPARVGLVFSGVGLATGSPGAALETETGLALGLQVRAASQSMLGLEVESLRADRYEGTQRRTLAIMATGQLYLWDSPVTAFFAGAGGFESARAELGGARDDARRLVGKIGGGIELRFGPHLALAAQLMGVEKLRIDRGRSDPTTGEGGPEPIEDVEGGLEGRLSANLRF